MKDMLIKAIREVPITDKTYEEYVEALAEKISAKIVTCKDCKRWTPNGRYGLDLDGTKRPYGECSVTKTMAREDHYCSYGRRREK